MILGKEINMAKALKKSNAGLIEYYLIYPPK